MTEKKKSEREENAAVTKQLQPSNAMLTLKMTDNWAALSIDISAPGGGCVTWCQCNLIKATWAGVCVYVCVCVGMCVCVYR